MHFLIGLSIVVGLLAFFPQIIFRLIITSLIGVLALYLYLDYTGFIHRQFDPLPMNQFGPIAGGNG